MNALDNVTLIAGWAQTDLALAPLVESLDIVSSDITCGPRFMMLTSVASLLDDASAVGSQDAGNIPSVYAVALASRLARSNQPATLIGWSMGGMVALEMAMHFPGLVGRLVLLSSCAVFCPPSTAQEEMPTLPVRALIIGLHRDHRETLHKFFSLVYSETDESEPLMRDRNRAMDLAPEHLVHGLRYIQRIDLRSRLSTVTVPTLLVHGKKDQVISWQASQHLHAGIRGSELLLIDEGDHGLVATSPEIVAAAVMRFLSGDAIPS